MEPDAQILRIEEIEAQVIKLGLEIDDQKV